MAEQAARLALEDAGIAPEDLDLLLVGTITADHVCLLYTSIVEEGVKVVTTGAGSPAKYLAMWKAAGVKVIPVVASVAMAKICLLYTSGAWNTEL